MKKLLLIIYILARCKCFGVQSANQDVKNSNGKKLFDASSVAPSDAIDIKNINGKHYYVYHVKSGDGWYSIARKFNISYSELRLANKEKDDHLYPGREILVPANKLKPTDPFYKKKYVDVHKTSSFEKQEVKLHMVTSSQTLFSIAKMYGKSVGQLKEWNKLTSNTISLGQKLIIAKDATEEKDIVKKEPEDKTAISSTTTTTKIVELKSSDILPLKKQEVIMEQKDLPKEKVDFKTSENTEEKKNNIPVQNVPAIEKESSDEKIVFANGRYEVNENGLATFIEDEDTNTDKYYALHRTAPIGTVIRVLNMANSRKIYVKINGQLSDASENEGIIIKISKASAEKLGVTEKSFQANLLYGINKE